MNKTMTAIAVLVCASASALAVWGVKDLPRFTAAPAPKPASSGSAPVMAPSTATLADVRSQPAKALENVAAGELAFRRVVVETGGDAIEACLTFSADLTATGAVRYADYVQLPAGVKAGFRVDGKRLCLSGFAVGSEYTLTLRAGLPAAGGETLAQAADVMVAFGDRPSSVRFGTGFVLPREAVEGLPVTTVNASRLEVKVYRVGDRLLARMRQDLVDDRTTYPYRAREVANDEGRLVWSGEIPVSGPRNEAVITLFPLDKAVGKAEPGAYLVTARDPDVPQNQGDEEGYYDAAEYRPIASQWVVQSDLGLTSFTAADGLTLAARSLHSAKPLAGVRMVLIARNNDVLAETQTGGDGTARFAPGLLRGAGGLAPVMVMAYGGDDFNFMDLRRPAFDLSDRGVDGRAPSGPVDAFLYSERGIYRPGETVHLVGMLRDAAAKAIVGRDWIVKITRPDGKEYRRFSVSDQGGGAAHSEIKLPADAARGNWEASIHLDPEGPAAGRLGFEVQDFVPQRLGLTIGERPAFLRPGAALTIPVEARFLYGAPASALGGEAQLTLEPDPAPFPAYKDFRWGIENEAFDGGRLDLAVSDTDAQGRTVVSGAVPDGMNATRPLRADIGIAVREPGGRATAEHVYIPLNTRDVALGLRPHFDGSVRAGQDAVFDLIAVDAGGARKAVTGLEYRLLKDVSTWQWYRSGANWRYERVAREQEIDRGLVDVGGNGPKLIRHQVEWGLYRVMVRDPVSGATSSVSFWGGWYGAASADRPDRLKIAADKAGYQSGETARLHVDSEAAGEALLVIANERLHETRNISIPAGGGDVEVKIGAEWGAGAYAMITLYRPLADKPGRAPVRAVGTAWLGLDPAQRTLSITVDAPERIVPRSHLTVPIKVSGGDKAMVTLAAVDQGILQLTRFKTPSPQGHYLSKRRLGAEMRDDYGRLIRGLTGSGDDQGGDAFGGKGLDVVPTRTTALFSGLVRVDADGMARIALDIPDFQGELRLMAVAFDADKTGSAEARVIVRDPLVAELILPRFLAPGDQGGATALVHNVDGAAGIYSLDVRMGDAVTAPVLSRKIQLAKGQREVFTLPIQGTSTGIGFAELSMSGPDGFAVTRNWRIQVRAPQLPITLQDTASIAPGETVMLGAERAVDLRPETVLASVSVSRWQGLDVVGLLRWMDRYPFGCLEQTTSRAMPLLYFNEVAATIGSHQDKDAPQRIQDAVERIASLQMAEGDFGMWSGWGESADPWLSVFALDFLSRAADKGYDVPAATMNAGRRWLAGGATRYDRSDVSAYAMAVLARKGLANAGDLRYLADQKPPAEPIALAHLGAALDAVGERARAARAFDQAKATLAEWQRLHDSANADAAKALSKKMRPYGSLLRDAFGIAAIAAESGRSALVPSVLQLTETMETQADLTNTQEKAWMLLTAAATARNSGRLVMDLDGKPMAGGDPASAVLAVADLQRGVSLKNAGEGPVFRTVSASGVPMAPLPAAATGVTVAKHYFDMAGNAVDPTQVTRNDRLIVVLEGAASAKVAGSYAVLDLLPAGWDIEGVIRPDQPGYGWLGTLSDPPLRQGRDDRFVAALDLPEQRMADTVKDREAHAFAPWTFKLAYAVRAVSPGEYVLPAARVEHMYRPALQARTEMGRLTVTE
ncbi:alpha-2-macroglobulin family protein [Magnetospirillum sulfuroxidans]|uniref:Alpha-2-macroglobulin family protein n=1 Tax=Magnetospirillum sulfuroxidans TaxID=611300 RepID=A0ABS5IDN1_9PROT|nr:alpha-2-macroglobulin [Magnetospirillum sulfuroxidans]MBR9972547.1 alpha-2-macroglobulin family protein [Magnetospirillum sulfuroxidans]